MILALLACAERDKKTDGLFEDVFALYPAVSESTCPDGEETADCVAKVESNNEAPKLAFIAAFEDETEWSDILAGKKDLSFEVSRRRWSHSSTEDTQYTDVTVTIFPENKITSEAVLTIAVENYLTSAIDDPDPVRITSDANEAYFGVNDTTFEDFVKINRESYYEDEGYDIAGPLNELEVTAGILYSIGEEFAGESSCVEEADGEVCESVIAYEDQ